MRNIALPIIGGLAMWFGFNSQAAERGTEVAMPVPPSVCTNLQSLFQKYYPEATFTNRNVNGIRFEYKVTTFEFPPMDATGKHESPTQRGPKKGGILCTVYLQNGKYRGQLSSQAPPGADQYQVWLFDKKEYKEMLFASYSPSSNAHLWVGLSYPPDANKEFLNKFQAIMKDFAREAERK